MKYSIQIFTAFERGLIGLIDGKILFKTHPNWQKKN